MFWGIGMAGADAWGAPEGSTFARHNEGRANVAGNARIIAAPAYRRLLAAEPLLKRSIPILILIFLIVVASVRFLSLMALRDDVERDAKAVLGLAAGELVNALMLAGKRRRSRGAAPDTEDGPERDACRQPRARRHRRHIQDRRNHVGRG